MVTSPGGGEPFHNPFRGSLPHRLLVAIRRNKRDALRAPSAPKGHAPVALKQIYRLLHAGDAPAALSAMMNLYQAIGKTADEIEAVLVTLLACIAAQQPRRAEALADMIEACYLPEDRDRAAARAARRLRCLPASDLATGLRAIGSARDWASLALTARTAAASMAVHEVIEHPREARFARQARRARFGIGIGRRHTVVLLREGLGNQLFQYAAGLGYARRTGAQLHLDLDWYRRPGATRQFLLNRFLVPVHEPNPWQLGRARGHRHAEPSLGTDHVLLEGHGTIWLLGYWGHPRYFTNVEAELRRCFRPRNSAVAERARSMVESARSNGGPVVAIHIRRGDRVPGHAWASAPGSVLPVAYYSECVRRFPPGTGFLVFSDTPADIAWCRENLAGDERTTFHFSDGLDPVVDLFAIAAADHAILSAGTFSWWGAWLGDRPGRRVLAPHQLQSQAADRIGGQPPPPNLLGWEVVRFEPSERGFPRRGHA